VLVATSENSEVDEEGHVKRFAVNHSTHFERKVLELLGDDLGLSLASEARLSRTQALDILGVLCRVPGSLELRRRLSITEPAELVDGVDTFQDGKTYFSLPRYPLCILLSAKPLTACCVSDTATVRGLYGLEKLGLIHNQSMGPTLDLETRLIVEEAQTRIFWNNFQ